MTRAGWDRWDRMPKRDIEAIDAIFTSEMVDAVDDITRSADPEPADVSELYGDDDTDDDITMENIPLEELFRLSGMAESGLTPESFAEEWSSAVESADDDGEGPRISGIDEGEATPDAPGRVVDLDAAKRDKRTKRSQAYAKRKKTEKTAPDAPDGEPGESSVGDADLRGGAPEGDVADTDAAPPEPKPGKAKGKKGKRGKGKNERPRIQYETDASAETDEVETVIEPGRRASASKLRSSQVPDASGAGEEDYEEVDLPDWADSIRRKVWANVAHAFLMNGNVRDYMVRNIPIKDGIVAVLDADHEGFDIVATYDQAHGLGFYGDEIEVREGRTLADAYRERFIEEMQISQRHMSIPVTEDIPNKDTVQLFAILSDMFERPSTTRAAKILLFIDYSDLLVPDASSAQMKPDERKLAITLADIGRSQAADEAGNVLIFITDDMTQLSSRIRTAESRIEQVKVPIPDRDDRADFIEHVLDVPENTLSDGTRIFEHPDSISKDVFAINSAGLSRMQIEDIVLRALSEDEPLSMQLMKERKQEIIREDYDDVLEIVDPSFGFEAVGGLDLLKRVFNEEIIEPVHAGETEAVPMGVMLAGPPGSAKSVCVDCRVFCENGPVRAGDISPGDEIFARDGRLHRVLGVFPQGKRGVFEVVLADGRRVNCSMDHIWTVIDLAAGADVERDMTVGEMLDEGILWDGAGDGSQTPAPAPRFSVPLCAPVEYPERDLIADPYAVGVLVAGGLPSAEADLSGAAAEPAADRRIPEAYMHASADQRRSLLQGIMDVGGTISIAPEDAGDPLPVRLTSPAPGLCRDVAELAWSLGYSCSVADPATPPDPTDGPVCEPCASASDACIVAFDIPASEKPLLFREGAKRDAVEQAAALPEPASPSDHAGVGIREIRELGREEEMVCFLVDSDDHTYLVEDYVVTHNTHFSKAFAKEAGMNFVALNLNRIMEKWVGSTERNLDRALECALAMAPTVIFIDEIDEALPNRADPNASSVNKRINQRLLTFFSDTSHRGEVMILAATNYPEKIDPAFKRAGRFDMRIPMFAPDEFDRMRIMQAIAKRSGYGFSWFEDPSRMVDNPYKRLQAWIEDGNTLDTNDRDTFFGKMEPYSYVKRNEMGEEEHHEVHLPTRLISVIGRDRITLQQLYEVARILFTDRPKREADSFGVVVSEEVFAKQIQEYLETRMDVLGEDPQNTKRLYKRLMNWERTYSVFAEQTSSMTGAELDVVMIKAINLFKKWKREVGPEKVERIIEMGQMAHDRDIPWYPFLFEACKRTISASSGIKRMVDMALINTSDSDFIPDAPYGKTDDHRMISYVERHEELLLRTSKVDGE